MGRDAVRSGCWSRYGEATRQCQHRSHCSRLGALASVPWLLLLLMVVVVVGLGEEKSVGVETSRCCDGVEESVWPLRILAHPRWKYVSSCWRLVNGHILVMLGIQRL